MSRQSQSNIQNAEDVQRIGCEIESNILLWFNHKLIHKGSAVWFQAKATERF